MAGIDRHNGRAIDGQDHLYQSIADILTTPIGSRVLRRDYGSELPRLIDSPINSETVIDLYMATAEALDAWEPRINVQRIQLEDAEPGKASLVLDYEDNSGVYAQAVIDLELTS